MDRLPDELVSLICVRLADDALTPDALSSARSSSSSSSECAECALARLARTSKRLHALATPALYRSLVVSTESSSRELRGTRAVVHSLKRAMGKAKAIQHHRLRAPPDGGEDWGAHIRHADICVRLPLLDIAADAGGSISSTALGGDDDDDDADVASVRLANLVREAGQLLPRDTHDTLRDSVALMDFGAGAEVVAFVALACLLAVKPTRLASIKLVAPPGLVPATLVPILRELGCCDTASLTSLSLHGVVWTQGALGTQTQDQDGHGDLIPHVVAPITHVCTSLRSLSLSYVAYMPAHDEAGTGDEEQDGRHRRPWTAHVVARHARALAPLGHTLDRLALRTEIVGDCGALSSERDWRILDEAVSDVLGHIETLRTFTIQEHLEPHRHSASPPLPRDVLTWTRMYTRPKDDNDEEETLCTTFRSNL